MGERAPRDPEKKAAFYYQKAVERIAEYFLPRMVAKAQAVPEKYRKVVKEDLGQFMLDVFAHCSKLIREARGEVAQVGAQVAEGEQPMTVDEIREELEELVGETVIVEGGAAGNGYEGELEKPDSEDKNWYEVSDVGFTPEDVANIWEDENDDTHIVLYENCHPEHQFVLPWKDGEPE